MWTIHVILWARECGHGNFLPSVRSGLTEAEGNPPSSNNVCAGYTCPHWHCGALE